jgi:Na+/melibiose symporter-like transporter
MIEIVLTTLIMALFLIGALFGALAFAGRTMTAPDERSRLGTAIGNACGSLAVLLVTLGALFIMRLRAGRGGSLEPEWLYLALLVVLLVATVWCVVATLRAFPELIARLHNDGGERWKRK